MIDHDARKELAGVMRRYLNDELTAFQFDDALGSLSNSSDDAVRYVAHTLWQFYDDCTDHVVVLSKPEWDYFQRLMLLLETDYSVTVTHQQKLGLSQVVAFLLFLCCVFVALETGVGQHLLLWFIPFGVGSIAIERLRSRVTAPYPYRAIVTPFSTLHDLWAACEATGFRKVRYPSHLAARTIRSPVIGEALLIPGLLAWVCLAPIPLLVQCFPRSISHVDVKPA